MQVSATARKAVKVGVSEEVWRNLKAHCRNENAKIGDTVEKALEMYLDILRGEAVVVYGMDGDYDRYRIVNALELDLNGISGKVFIPLLGSFSKEVLEHFISLLAPYFTTDMATFVQNFEGTGERYSPNYGRVYPELLAREILAKKSYLHIDLSNREEPVPFPRIVVIGHDFADFGDLDPEEAREV